MAEERDWQLGVFVIDLLVEEADVFDQAAQVAEVVVAALDFFVDDDAVEAFLGGFGNEFFGEGDVFLAGEAEAVDDAFDFVFGVLDAFGDFDFLFAGEQRDLAHLLEVHADGVVQDVQADLVFVFVRFGLFDAVHFRLVDDFDFQVAQFAVEIVQFVRGDDAIGQGVVDVVVGQVALFLGQADEFLDLFGQVQGQGFGERGGGLGAGGEFQSGFRELSHGGGGDGAAARLGARGDGLGRAVPVGGGRSTGGLGAQIVSSFFL